MRLGKSLAALGGRARRLSPQSHTPIAGYGLPPALYMPLQIFTNIYATYPGG